MIRNRAAPYINQIARQGALFTRSRAVAHPSQPSYLALFSGSTQGVTSDRCPHRFRAPNLASVLIAAHKSFAGYSEGLPRTGSLACSSPAGHFGRLPTVSFVIPNMCEDMHSCAVAAGDRWLRSRLGGYLTWAMSHHSLPIVTWDENGGARGNIATIFAGQMIRAGRYALPITDYSVLRTVEAIDRLRPDGRARLASLITSVWK